MMTLLEKMMAKKESTISEKMNEEHLSEEQKAQIMETMEEWLAIWAN